MNTVSFKTTRVEAQLISKIVDRARNLGIVKTRKSGPKSERVYAAITCDMDLTACHANGNELDLQALLEADDFNFTHDVCGIARHINRDTGKLENFFVPRMSARTVNA
jgi:hypothetical protein